MGAAGEVLAAGASRVFSAVAKDAEGEIGDAIDTAAENCPLSFAPDTQVATPSSEQAIAALKVGDQVTAYDPASGKTSAQTVQHVFLNHDTDLLDVTLKVSLPVKAQTKATGKTTATARASGTAQHTITTHEETIHTTDTHPWLSADHGWLPASFLRVGEPVVTADGQTAVVEAIRAVPGATSMWDLTVSDVHTFAVGTGAYVVHNCGKGLPEGAPAGWEREDEILTTGETRSWFSRGTAGVDRVEVAIDHESGKMAIGWIDNEGGSALRRHLPGLLDWAGEGVKSIEGYATDGLLRHAQTEEGRAAISRIAGSMLGSRGFSGGLVQEGARWMFRFSRP